MVNNHLRIIFLRLLIHSQNSQNFWAAEISSYTVSHSYYRVSLSLCRLITRVQITCSQSKLTTPQPVEEKWNEFISDFWEERLPNFRRAGYNVRTFTASSAAKPPETIDVTESYSALRNELIQFTSERNLLEAFAEDELNLSASLTTPPPSEELEEPVTAPLQLPVISSNVYTFVYYYW